MGPNVLVFGWNRSLPGREMLSGQHFQEFSEFLAALQKDKRIESFDAVLLEPHGGTFNGCFLIRGEPARLGELTASPEWARHITRAMLHLDGSCVLRGMAGQALQERLQLWMESIPKP